MSEDSLAAAVLASATFQDAVDELAIRSAIADLAIDTDREAHAIDWNHALLCASAITATDDEAAQEAALRVTQGVLADKDADGAHREAAVILLERMGNREAVRLAEQRELADSRRWVDAPDPLRLDVIRRRLELGIPLASGGSLPANVFQRAFWDAASSSQWVSVSAPTSAGKSFIVKQWLGERLAEAESFRAVYLVPTRALIEEVTADLRGAFGAQARVFALPWDPAIGTSSKELHVLTQERLHVLHARDQDFAADLLFIDEAQKFGDNRRGVLLQLVLDEAVRRNPEAQVLFASPLARNPELLLDGAPTGSNPISLSREAITVNQNLLWVNSVFRKPSRLSVELIRGDRQVEIGQIELPAKPTSVPKRVALSAVALGGHANGNVVYVNSADVAEKVAAQIFDALGPERDISANPAIAALRELAQKTIHGRYQLVTVLNRGVAFHYGNMPLLVRSEIERLFHQGDVQFLVCTSTLLEGVNLPCRNLFTRGPRKGRGNVMSSADFWNLAGRAGRWGKEFQGNIVCIDTNDRGAWPEPPRQRDRQPLTRASDRVLTEVDSLRKYIAQGAPISEDGDDGLRESVFSFLAGRIAEGGDLHSIPGIRELDPQDAVGLEEDLRAVLQRIEIPGRLITRHAGVSPLGMQRLLEAFRAAADPHALMVAGPWDDDALNSYLAALGLIRENLGGRFGNEKRQYVIALLIVRWMRGVPLARLIEDRIKYYRRVGRRESDASIIRSTMADVEEMARFEVPKYLSCYIDVLKLHAEQAGVALDEEEVGDVEMMLELGVSSDTALSLMTLGLSRTSALEVADLIARHDLSPNECLTWLRDRDLRGTDVPALVLEEIARVMSSQPGGTATSSPTPQADDHDAV